MAVSDLTGTKWQLNDNISNTLPGLAEFEDTYYIDFDITIGIDDINTAIGGVSDWGDFIDFINAIAEGILDNFSSTLNASGASNSEKIVATIPGLDFYKETGFNGFIHPTVYPQHSYSNSISQSPTITGYITGEFNGAPIQATFSQALELLGIDFFAMFGYVYDISTELGSYNPASFQTLNITGGDDADNADLVAWLQANAVEVVPFTEGVRVTYNGDVIKQLDADGTFSLSCANKLMTSNITIETLDVGSIVVTYDNDTIIDSSGAHTYQLPCNGKMADTDIVVTLVMTILPDNLLVTSEGNYIVDVSDGYLITASPSSGYSGNITVILNQPTGGLAGMNRWTKIKFGSAPTSDSDYDSYVDDSGIITGSTSYSNETKVYVWGYNSGITINSTGTNGGSYNTAYSSAVEVILTGNYDIVLWYYPIGSSGGSGN